MEKTEIEGWEFAKARPKEAQEATEGSDPSQAIPKGDRFSYPDGYKLDVQAKTFIDFLTPSLGNSFNRNPSARCA